VTVDCEQQYTPDLTWPERLNLLIDALIDDRYPPRPIARSLVEWDDVLLALLLAGARSGNDQPSPWFIAHLRRRLLRRR
jgi:hypothetical protein